MSKDDLGPKPDAKIEPGEPNPGGVDAIDGDDHREAEPTIPNLPTDKNPAISDAAPDEMKQGEDTSTQATQDDEEPMDAEDESPA
jgi:hypothetical protein